MLILCSCQVAEVTFNFWYRLSEALFKGEDEAKTALFRPYFESLFEALCVHCRLESDAVSTSYFNMLVFLGDLNLFGALLLYFVVISVGQ